MPKKMEVLMLSVREAIVDGYSEIEQLNAEIHQWWMRRGPKLGPDSAVISMRVRDLCRDLEAVEAPDVTSIPDEIAECRVRANVCVDSHSRDVRCGNAEAKLRPAIAALRRGGLGELAEKIRNDTLRLPLVFSAAHNPP
jgi:hypothetical protein